MLTRTLISVSLVSLWCHVSGWPGASLHAQDSTGALSGSVVNGAGQPLANVRITVLGTRCSTVTDAAGAFELLAIPAGTYTVRAELTGYVSSELPGVRISADQIVRAEFRLAPPRVIPPEAADTCPHHTVPHSHILAVATPSLLPAQVLGHPHRETSHGCAAHPLSQSPLGLADRALVSWVGIYGIGELEVEVGASRFGYGSGARIALQRAVEGQPMQDVFRAGDTEVHVVIGPGERTYVFAANELIWWITGPDDLARTVLAGLLNMPELAIAHPTSPGT
jgi:hypothetical protein